MKKIIDALKMAWVYYAEDKGWDYSVTLSNGSSFSRKNHKLSAQSSLHNFKQEYPKTIEEAKKCK